MSRPVPPIPEGSTLVRLPVILNEESGYPEAFCTKCNEVTFQLIQSVFDPPETVPHICPNE